METTKKAIEIIASEETYRNLSSFKSTEELNEAVRNHIELLNSLKERARLTALEVIKFIRTYSVKFPGVSFLTKNNIAASLGVSRRTVIRACAFLEAQGVIRQYEIKRRSDMKQTANAIVIQKAEKLTVTQADELEDNNCHTKKPTTSLKPNNYKTNNHDVIHKAIQYVKYVPKIVNKLYYEAFSSELKDMWDRICKASKASKVTVTKEHRQAIGKNVLSVVKDFVHNGQATTPDERCALTYKVALRQFSALKTDEPKGQTAVRREKLPKWFKNEEKADETFNPSEEEKDAFENLLKKFR